MAPVRATESDAAGAPTHPWRAFLDIGPRFAGGDNDTVVDLYLPLAGDGNSLVMGTVRGLTATDEREYLSAGLIARWLDARENPEESWIYGGSLFVDVPHTADGATYFGIGAGVEAMSADWELRLNGYLPIADTTRNDAYAAVFLEDDRIFMRGGEEHWLAGLDGEIGWRLPFDAPGADSEIWLRGGGYWFDHRQTGDRHGFTASAEYVWREVPWELIPFSEFRVEAGLREDSVEGTEGYLGISGRIDLGMFANDWPEPRDPVARRMEDPWRRLDRPILGGAASGPEEPVIDPVTGLELREVIRLDPGDPALPAGLPPGGISRGPAAFAAPAQAPAEGRLIVVSGAVPGTLTLQQGDTLYGGWSALPLVGAQSGATALYLPTFEPGTVLLQGGVGVEAAGYTHISGLRFLGSDAGVDEVGLRLGDGLPGAGSFDLDQITVDNSLFEDIGGHGVMLDDYVFDLNLRDNTFRNIALDAIRLGELVDAEITGNTFADNGGRGVSLDSATGVRVANNRFTDVEGGGIFSFRGANLTVTGNVFAGDTLGGIELVFGSGVDIRDNHFGPDLKGGVFARSVTGLGIRNNVFETAQVGVVLDGNTDGLVIAGNRFEGFDSGAITALSGAGIVGGEISGNFIRSDAAVEAGGIVLNTTSASQLSITGNTVALSNAAGRNGIWVAGMQAGTIADNTVSVPLGGGIGVDRADDVMIARNVLTDTAFAITAGTLITGDGTQNVTIRDNLITGGRVGVAIGQAARDIAIVGNRFARMDTGIYVAENVILLSVLDNSFADLGEFGMTTAGPVGDTVVAGNVFTGDVGQGLFLLNGTAATEGFSGSGNVNATDSLGGQVCQDLVPASAGTGFSFTDGTVCAAPP